MLIQEPLHGVVVSRDYADYLDIALSHNRPLFDRCVVVTVPDDHESKRIAGKHACQLVVTEDGIREGQFDKGAMIERGLQQLPQHGWRVHFDADIVLPGDALNHLNLALTDRACIYGADRFNVVGWEEWQKVLASGWATRGFEHHHFLSYPINRAEVGGRLVYYDQGWLPLGFLQIWHAEAEYSGIYRTRCYPKRGNSAAHSDVQMALLWDRAQRLLIPEFYVGHLCTPDNAFYGQNWKGRTTVRFGPPGHGKPAEDPTLDTGDQYKL